MSGSSLETIKVWFITGASSGLGRALVHAVIARKDKVIATARDHATIANLHNETGSKEDQLRTLQLDLTDSTENVNARVAEAVGYWGRIDVLVNNASFGTPTFLEEGGLEALDWMFQTNVYGTMRVTYAVLPYMRKVRSGTVVIIGSRSAARNELPGIGFYSASKAAIHSLGETLAAEVRPFNICVTVIQPGAFRTNMIRDPYFSKYKIPAYDEMRVAARNLFGGMAGRARGDPAKAMQILVDVVRGEGKFEGKELPLWLALGPDSVKDMKIRAQQIIDSIDKNADISVTTDLTDS